MASNDANDWELSKENIQPLKKGRKVSTLITALDESKHAMLNMQKMEFEKQIRAYSGEDPLQVWYQYVLWMEQNYPKGGKESNLVKLLESCFNFVNEKCGINKYRNDERYLELWIKYADHCPKPIEVYSLLYSQGICINFPALYENWSYQYEKFSNVNKANEIYIKGLEQPELLRRQHLQTSHKHFQMRVAKMTADQLQVEKDNDEPVEEVREIGNVLKGKEEKKHVKAPIERVGLTILGRGGNIQSESTGNCALPNFPIFHDGNKQTVPKEPGVFQVPSLEEHVNDDKKPSKWNKCKSRPSEALPISSLPNINSLQFPVYADPVASKDPKSKHIVSGALAEKKAEGAWKMPLFSGDPTEEKSKPMYCKSRVYCGTAEFSLEELRAMDYFQKLKMTDDNNDKEDSSAKESEIAVATCEVRNLNPPSFKLEPFDPRSQPQYPKNKVYCNGEEFSLEEIRARKYWEDAKEKEEEQKLKDEIDNLKRMVLQKQEVINTLMKEKAESQSSSQKSIEIDSAISAIEEPVEMKSSFSKKLVSIENELTTAAIQEPIEMKSACPRKQNTVKLKPAYEDSWITINKSVAEPNETNWLDESTKGLLLMMAAESATLPPPELQLETTGTMMATPLRSRMERPGNGSMREVQPSPTINTKLAINCVAELFNRTLSTSVYSKTCEPEDEYEQIELPQDEPFEIYHDDLSQKPKSSPFIIYQDENDPVISRRDSKTGRRSRPLLAVRTAEPSIKVDHAEICPEVECPAEPSIGFERLAELSPKIECLAGLSFEVECPAEPSYVGERPAEASYVGERPAEACAKVTSYASQKSPINNDDEDRENQGLLNQHKVKRTLSGILLPSRDILIDEPIEELAVPLETEFTKPTAFKVKPSLPEDFTVRLPSSGVDFAKMASIASTPNPWSFGFVPQKDVNDDFTMKAPSITINKPQLSEGISSELSNLKLDTPLPSLSNFVVKPEITPTVEESLRLSAIRSNNMTCRVSPCVPNTTNVLPKHNNLPSSEIKNIEDDNDSFDPDKVAAMLWNEMNPDFSLKIEATQPDSHQDRENLLVAEVPYPSVIDPFCNDLKSLLLSSLKEPLESRGGFVSMHSKFPQIKPNTQLTLDKEQYRIRYLRGKGNYAQIYQAFTEDPMNVTVFSSSDDDFKNNSQMALKVQIPPCYWEFYICHEIRRRLKKSDNNANVVDAIMKINRAYFYKQGSIFATHYHSRGSLLDLTNGYKMAGKTLSQAVALYIVIELLVIVDGLHSCGIIHADLKPDNVLIQRVPSEINFTDKPLSTVGPFLLKLIDFGRSIDLNLLPKGCTFTKKISTDGFTCCEMRDGRPWTYHTDYYGLAAIVHCLLWGSYMNVQKKGDRWMLSGVSMQRHWNKELWNYFFDQLLNVEPGTNMLDLKVLRERFISEFNLTCSPSNIEDRAFILG